MCVVRRAVQVSQRLSEIGTERIRGTVGGGWLRCGS